MYVISERTTRCYICMACYNSDHWALQLSGLLHSSGARACALLFGIIIIIDFDYMNRGGKGLNKLDILLWYC